MRITDHPMACCGLMEVSHFSKEFTYPPDQYGPGKPWHLSTPTDPDRGFPVLKYRGQTPTVKEEDWDAFFKYVESLQLARRRNTCMITLVRGSSHGGARDASQRAGYVLMKEFFNPNSGNICEIWTKTLWEKHGDLELYCETRGLLVPRFVNVTHDPIEVSIAKFVAERIDKELLVKETAEKMKEPTKKEADLAL